MPPLSHVRCPCLPLRPQVHSLAEALRKRGMGGAAQAVEEEAHRAAEAKAQLAAAAAAAGGGGPAGSKAPK